MNSTLLVREVKYVHDMCHTKTVDGTACLLLCYPFDKCVQAVEVVSGRTRWKIGKQQMSVNCCPWSICKGKNKEVYVADWPMLNLHILSREDGSLISTINLKQYGVLNSSCVFVQDEHICLIHTDEMGDKYQKSKFSQL